MAGHLTTNGGGYTFTDEDDTVEQYDAGGYLQSITYRGGYTQTVDYESGRVIVTDSVGLSYTLFFNGSTQLWSLSTPDGTVQYGYDSLNRLSTVTYPDQSVRTYQYNDANHPDLLTGVVDENNSAYASIEYDSSGRAIHTAFTGGLWASTVDYTDPDNPIVRDARNVSRTYHFTSSSGRQQLSSISGSPCNTCDTGASQSFDAAGYYASRTDWNGHLTTYVYDDARGLELLRTEAANDASPTPATRTITTAWEPNFRLPHLISEYTGGSSGGVPTGTLLRQTTLTHDGSGNLTQKTVKDVASGKTRSWIYSSFTSWGAPQTITGPRSDVSDIWHIGYYTCTTGSQCGQINTVTDPLDAIDPGHHTVTYNSYDASGRPLTITNANGIQTTLTYWPRGWINTITVNGSQTTTFNYWPTGQIQQINYPSGAVRSFFYNAAHQLTDVYDRPAVSGSPPTAPGNANHIHYTVDAMDNVTGIDVRDTGGTLVQTHSRVYNSLNQLWKDVGALSATETTVYDNDSNGNLKQITDPLNHITNFNYDALNRLTQSINPNQNSSTLSTQATTTFGLNALDQLVSVQDPRGLTTQYHIDALDEVNQIISPDSGTTDPDQTNTPATFDGDGNVTRRTDANGHTTLYQYDALDRLTLLTRSDGTTVTLTYDQKDLTHGFGIGHLTNVVDNESGFAVDWTYDAWGHITKRKETIGSVALTTQWAYDATTGNLQTMTLPSTVAIGYTWTNGLITSMTLNNNPLVSGISYFPFGGPTQWSLGNQEADARYYDTDGRPYIDSVEAICYDAASRVTGWNPGTCTSNPAVAFGYQDPMDWVNSYTGGGTTLSYIYEANGNRRTQTVNGTNTIYTIDTASNRIASSRKGIVTSQYLYDADGSRTGIKTVSLTYDASERLIASGSATYAYDGLGERLKKKVSFATTLFAYDNQGHLIGEYNATGHSPLETIYLGDMPIALNNAGTTYYIHTDYRNAPRQIDNASGQAVWTWSPQPFGDNLPNSNPSGLGAFTYNLRFPGQYYDSESGNNYNYFRNYDSATGRYLESDPIGLGGGINTYVYGLANPLSHVDPKGLAAAAPPGIPYPPDNIPGGPWTWSPDSQNSRGGKFIGPKPPGGGPRMSCTYAPPGPINPDPYWKTNAPDGTNQRYSTNGEPITPDQAHPGPNRPSTPNPAPEPNPVPTEPMPEPMAPAPIVEPGMPEPIIPDIPFIP